MGPCRNIAAATSNTRPAGIQREKCLNFCSRIPPEYPMKVSMYQSSIPPITRSLNNLAAILEKAAAHAESKKIEPEVLVNSRLYPDMFPLVKQVQLASDIS